jgi:hypothetical protein
LLGQIAQHTLGTVKRCRRALLGGYNLFWQAYPEGALYGAYVADFALF